MHWLWIVPLILLALSGLYLLLIRPNLPRRDIAHLRGYDYAHRGLWNAALPENSLGAFASAVESGFGIELDVHLTSDGQLAVFHDDSLLRICGTDRPIHECTMAELEAMPLKGTAWRIPTFAAVLELVDGRVPLIVEIKAGPRLEELCRKTCDMLRRYCGPCCVESFHPLVVRWFRKNAPDMIRGQLAYGLGMRKPTALNLMVGSLVQNALGRPDFIAFEAATDGALPMRLMRRMRPHLVCWTIHSQRDMDAQRRRYDLQIFDSFVPKR